MSALDLLQNRRALALRRLHRAESELAALRHDRASDAADDEHDPEGVPLSGEWSRWEGLRLAARTEIDDIDGALERATDGGYGICIGCGQQIPAERLDIRPDATRCVACAQRAGH